jgi:hypothetical protein
MSFDEHRRYQACAFCGATPKRLTAEHIIGSKFAHFLNIEHRWRAHEKNVLGNFVRDRSGTSAITNIAPQLLCSECNSTRFSQFTTGSLPALTSMATGAAIPDMQVYAVALRKYFDRMGYILDVCSSNFDLAALDSFRRHLIEQKFGRRRPPVLSSIDRLRFAQELTPEPLIRVYLGNHPGVLGLFVFFSITHFRESLLENDDPTDMIVGKRMTFVLRNLAVCLEVGNQSVSLARPAPSFHLLSDLESWPPAGPHATYEDVLGLPEQDLETRAERYRWANSALRAEPEALFRLMDPGPRL